MTQHLGTTAPHDLIGIGFGPFNLALAWPVLPARSGEIAAALEKRLDGSRQAHSVPEARRVAGRSVWA